jgi:prepilin-type N-terminal cleavage/methylation domain-containing protein
MQIQTKRQSGFTLVEIMIVVAIIGLLAAIAIPNFVRAREQAQLNSIVNNLRIIEGAKDQYALENKKGTGDTTDLTTISSYLKGGTINTVVNETYTTDKVGTASTAKIGVDLGTYKSGSSITAP